MVLGLFPTYSRFDVTVKQAYGTTLEDINGKTYLDFGTGIGVCNLGHRHPHVEKAVANQLEQFWHASNLYHIPIQEEVAKKITENSPADAVFFCSSGAEANEAAIKLARKASGKDKIITFHQSFHGRTLGTMAATGQEKVRVGFGAVMPTFEYATYNDIESVKALLDEETAAVMVEMIQGEGGVNPAEKAFIQALAKLCKEQEVLLVVDEIQTGMARTGKIFAFEHYGIEPDIFTLAKGLGNGIPIGAMAAKEALKDDFGPGSHGSTFGGNPVALAAASAVCDTIFDHDFLDEVAAKASYLHEALEEHLAPLAAVKEIRHKGLMIGIECHEKTMEHVKKLIENGLLVLPAGEKVVRLLPPLTVTEEEIDQAVALLKEELSK